MNKSIKFLICIMMIAFIFLHWMKLTTVNATEVLKGEAKGVVMLNGEPWGSGKLIFTNVSGDASFVVSCDKDISAGANSASCIGTDVNGFFSGGPNGYAIFGSGSKQITLQLVDGKKFTYSQSGVTAELEVVDPSIFKNWGAVDEDEVGYEPEEYDPNAPLTDSNARATDIDGQVEIACPPDFEAWDVLKPGRIIYNHCRLKTGEDSTLRISFSNMATFVMKPETEIIINEAIKEKTNLQLLFGGIWANVKKMAKGEEFGFKGSQAVAGIKGTTFIMEETGEKTTLKVIEGTVRFASKVKGRSVDVLGGQGIAATAEGLREVISIDVEAENAKWTGLSRTQTSVFQNTQPTTMISYVLVGCVAIALTTVAIVFIKKRSGQRQLQE